MRTPAPAPAIHHPTNTDWFLSARSVPSRIVPHLSHETFRRIHIGEQQSVADRIQCAPDRGKLLRRIRKEWRKSVLARQPVIRRQPVSLATHHLEVLEIRA